MVGRIIWKLTISSITGGRMHGWPYHMEVDNKFNSWRVDAWLALSYGSRQ